MITPIYAPSSPRCKPPCTCDAGTRPPAGASLLASVWPECVTDRGRGYFCMTCVDAPAPHAALSYLDAEPPPLQASALLLHASATRGQCCSPWKDQRREPERRPASVQPSFPPVLTRRDESAAAQVGQNLAAPHRLQDILQMLRCCVATVTCSSIQDKGQKKLFL